MQITNQRLNKDNLVLKPEDVPSPRSLQVVYWEDGTAQIKIQHTDLLNPENTRLWFTDSMSHEEIESKRIDILQQFMEEV
jgi:hypothetical protein